MLMTTVFSPRIPARVKDFSTCYAYRRVAPSGSIPTVMPYPAIFTAKPFRVAPRSLLYFDSAVPAITFIAALASLWHVPYCITSLASSPRPPQFDAYITQSDALFFGAQCNAGCERAMPFSSRKKNLRHRKPFEIKGNSVSQIHCLDMAKYFLIDKLHPSHAFSLSVHNDRWRPFLVA